MGRGTFDLGMRWGGRCIAHRVPGQGLIFDCGCCFVATTVFGAEWHLCPDDADLEEVVDAAFSEQYGICSSAPVTGRRQVG